MSDKETEEGAVESSTESRVGKQHGLFGAAGIELTEPELSSPTTIKFLRHLNSTQEVELSKLSSYESQYYDKRQECEVLKKEKDLLEKDLKSKKELENVQKVMISMGSLLLATLKLLDGQPWYVMFLLALVSASLILGGMFPVLRIGAAK